MKITEKAAYLKGLSEGLNYDKTTAEGKLIAALIDLTAELSEEVERLDKDNEYLNDYCEELDEDLGDLEEVVLGLDDDSFYDDEDEEDDEDDEDEEFYSIECPYCGATVEFDASIDPSDLICPACKKHISMDIGDDE